MPSLGTSLGISSLFVMSLAPLFNKYASVNLNWMWGAALSSLFCFSFAAIASPTEVRKLLSPRSILNRDVCLIALTNVAGLLCQYCAVALLAPATLSILGRVYVVFAVILAQVVLREKSTRLEQITLLFVLVGAALFCWNKDLTVNVLGVALCLAYCFFFALTHLQVKIETRRSSANQILLVNNLISALVLIPIAYWFAGNLPLSDGAAIGFIGAAAFFGQWLGLLLFFESLKRIPLVKANLIRSFSPIVGAAVTYPFFPVHFSGIQFIGATTMVGALILQATWKSLNTNRIAPSCLRTSAPVARR